MNDFKENKDSKYLMYLKANTLHGWKMSQYLPTNVLKFVKCITDQNMDILQK